MMPIIQRTIWLTYLVVWLPLALSKWEISMSAISWRDYWVCARARGSLAHHRGEKPPIYNEADQYFLAAYTMNTYPALTQYIVGLCATFGFIFSSAFFLTFISACVWPSTIHLSPTWFNPLGLACILFWSAALLPTVLYQRSKSTKAIQLTALFGTNEAMRVWKKEALILLGDLTPDIPFFMFPNQAGNAGALIRDIVTMSVTALVIGLLIAAPQFTPAGYLGFVASLVGIASYLLVTLWMFTRLSPWKGSTPGTLRVQLAVTLNDLNQIGI